MSGYLINGGATISCDDNGATILQVVLNLQGQTVAQLVAQAQSALAALLTQALTLNPDCTNFALEVSFPENDIDFTVHSHSLLLLISEAYTELVFALVNL